MERTHLVTPKVNTASGVISSPFSPVTLDMENMDSTVAIAIQRLSLARWRPGQVLFIPIYLEGDPCGTNSNILLTYDQNQRLQSDVARRDLEAWAGIWKDHMRKGRDRRSHPTS